MPEITFFMDGTEHILGRTSKCCHMLRKRCICGAWRHGQAVYGGIMYMCENCDGKDIAEARVS